MVSRHALLVSLFVCLITSAFGEALAQADPESPPIEVQQLDRRHSIGSSLFLLGNLAPGDPPYYFQLNYRYQPALKHAMVVEAITWTYYAPLGTYGDSDEKYPGKVRAYGIGVGYQHFHWKGLYSTAQATPFLQQFYDTKDKKIQNGFQLFLQLRTGYHFNVFRQRWFLEPSIAFNYWPVNTNFPQSFKEVKGHARDYFLFEPGLHCGYRF